MSVLKEKEIQDKLKSLKGWKYEEPVITKEYEFKDFREAFSKMTAIAFIAEEHMHHPDWENSFNSLKISLTSHEEGGITEKDFKMAEEIEEVV